MSEEELRERITNLIEAGKTTVSKISRNSGVAIGTVSRFYRNTGFTRKETLDKIREAIE